MYKIKIIMYRLINISCYKYDGNKMSFQFKDCYRYLMMPTSILY